MAPEPEDIIWPVRSPSPLPICHGSAVLNCVCVHVPVVIVMVQNLGIGKWEKRLRVVYVNLTLLFFFSFFTTPLSIISALQPLKQVRPPPARRHHHPRLSRGALSMAGAH